MSVSVSVSMSAFFHKKKRETFFKEDLCYNIRYTLYTHIYTCTCIDILTYSHMDTYVYTYAPRDSEVQTWLRMPGSEILQYSFDDYIHIHMYIHINIYMYTYRHSHVFIT